MTEPPHADAAARALDALSPEEAEAFDQHVADCEQCALEYAEFLATAAMLAGAVAEPPPEGLREKVLRAAARTPQLPPLTVPPGKPDAAPGTPDERAGRHRRTDTRWRRPVLLVAAAVIAVLIAGGVIWATRPGTSPEQAAAACVASAPDAQVRHPEVGTGGSVTVSRSCDAAVVLVATMPPPPTGKAYQLWVMAGSAARSAGMVAHDENASGRIVVTGLKPSDTDIGISVEPSGGSTGPTTTPIWVVPLDT